MTNNFSRDTDEQELVAASQRRLRAGQHSC